MKDRLDRVKARPRVAQELQLRIVVRTPSRGSTMYVMWCDGMIERA